jgi:DNA-binding response OmpR family regulator
MRVLIIDDDDVARELLASTLEDAGHEVFELPSAIGATREIYRNAIDAVVVDVMMPDINGDKLAKVLRQNSRGARLVIILVSSRPAAELEQLANSAGADAVLTKSKVRMELGTLLASACEHRQHQRAEGIGA